MLFPKQAAQPNPSYPALCRQDNTSPWSTDYGGNSLTLILTPAIQNIWKKYKKKEKEDPFSSEKKKKEMKNIKKNKKWRNEQKNEKMKK